MESRQPSCEEAGRGRPRGGVWSPVTLSGVATKGPTWGHLRAVPAGCGAQDGPCPAVWACGRETLGGASPVRRVPRSRDPFPSLRLSLSITQQRVWCAESGRWPRPSGLPGGWSDARGSGQGSGGRGPAPRCHCRCGRPAVPEGRFPLLQPWGREARASPAGPSGRGAAWTGPTAREAGRGAHRRPRVQAQRLFPRGPWKSVTPTPAGPLETARYVLSKRA